MLGIVWIHGVLLCSDCKINLNNGPVSVQASLSNLGYWSLCSLDCKVRFLKRWLRVHFEEGAAIGDLLSI